ncbi:MAG: peptidylprolyl isomerase [Anaerolineales bacterium]|nr:peptidylprolyl isomerase [Anaerolineales bacterium]
MKKNNKFPVIASEAKQSSTQFAPTIKSEIASSGRTRALLAMTITLTFSIFFLLACSTQAETPTPQVPIEFTPIVIPNTPTPTFTCTKLDVAPTSTPNAANLFPPVSGADYAIGPADAPVTLIQYCDFQSQGCLAMSRIVVELMRNHSDLRFVFRPLPLSNILDKSDASVLAALAAGEQDKFWEMYDLLFVRYNEWVNLTPNQFQAWILRESTSAGIDSNQLEADMKAEETATKLASSIEAAKQLNIAAVPLILINGTQFYLLDYQNISDTIGIIALGQKQFTECPPFAIDTSKTYIATLETEKGNIVIQLFADKAPLAVNSFVFLAKQGWYDGVTFHRVIPGFVAQAGDPSGTGRGNPGYFFKTEVSDLLFTKPGLVGMANSGPDTNGSQFFITYAPANHLNGAYTIFGQVIKGLDVAEKLTPRDPAQFGTLAPGDMIIKVTIEEK